MRILKVTKQFKKDLKKVKRNSKFNIEKLFYIVDILSKNGELPPEYLPHQLIGNWKPHWDCHIQPDFILIYAVDDKVLKLARCGSHSELF